MRLSLRRPAGAPMPSTTRSSSAPGTTASSAPTISGKAGLKVLVLERREIAGGATVTEEIWPGYKISVASYVMTLLQPKIMIDLDLRRHGVEVVQVGPSFQPFEDGRSLVFWPDTAAHGRGDRANSRRPMPRPIRNSSRIWKRSFPLCAGCCSRRRSIRRPAASRTSARPCRSPGASAISAGTSTTSGTC